MIPILKRLAPAFLGLLLTASLLIAPAAQTTAAAAAPAAKLAVSSTVDTGAWLSLHPAGFQGAGAEAFFSAKHTKKSRPVQLQQSTDGVNWTVLKTAKLAASGLVEFWVTPVAGVSYKAVAPKYKSKKAVETSPTSYLPGLAAHYDFATGALPAGWTDWTAVGYGATGRKCSAPKNQNWDLTSAGLSLKITQANVAANRDAAKRAGCASKWLSKGYVFDNSMLSTAGQFTMSTGIVQSRMKFAKGRGMHGGLWLYATSGSNEIDLIEAYGAGKQITHNYHPRKGTKKAFYTKNKSSSWYAKEHTVSVEWNHSYLVFRVDGKVTKAYRASQNKDYFLVLSLLSSDWELKNLKASKLSSDGKMTVRSITAWT